MGGFGLIFGCKSFQFFFLNIEAKGESYGVYKDFFEIRKINSYFCFEVMR